MEKRNLSMGFVRLEYDKNGKHKLGKYITNEGKYD